MTKEEFENLPLDKKMEYLRKNIDKEPEPELDIPSELKDMFNMK